VALLTPPLLTPPVGTLVASGFGEEKKKIFLYMFISSILWGLILCYASYGLKEEIEVIKEFLSVVIRSTANSTQRIFIL
jgi:membrane protein DedA with SNARE-associated domain